MPATTHSHVTCTVTDGIAEVRLDRPEKLNALTLQILDDLVGTARTLRRDKSLRAVVISGEGDAFCAGLDFAHVLKQPTRIVTSFVPNPLRGTNTFQEACWAWRRLPVPVIAAVHGHCLGGGLQIALAADFRVATPDSQWSVLEGKWGIIPDMSGVRSLKELVGIDVAKRLTMTAEVVSGKEAHDLVSSPASTATPAPPRWSSPSSSRAARPTSSRRPSGSSTTPGPRARAAPSPASGSSSCGCWPPATPASRARPPSPASPPSSAPGSGSGRRPRGVVCPRTRRDAS